MRLFRTTLLCAVNISVLATAHVAVCEDAIPKEVILQLAKFSLLINEQNRQLVEQGQKFEDQQARFNEYRQKMERQLQEQQQRIEELQARTAALPHPASTSQLAQAEAKGDEKTSKQNQSSETTTKGQKISPKGSIDTPATVGIPPTQPKEQKPPEIATIFEQPGVLTPRGKLVIEPSFQYSHSTSNRISLIGYTIVPSVLIGLIDVRTINRDTFIGSLAARYGLTNRLELEAKIPYVYRMESTLTKQESLETNTLSNMMESDGKGIGDVDFGLRYQLNTPTSGPYYIAALKVKSDTGKGPFALSVSNGFATEQPTGSGFWALQGGLSAIYPTDPAVFFGGVSYLWNIKRHIAGDYNFDFDPGDAIGFNFGMGLALNEKASFSIGYDHSIIGNNKKNGQTIPYSMTTHVGTLLFGYSLRLGEKTMANFSLGVGVTEAAPEVQLTLRIPFNL